MTDELRCSGRIHGLITTQGLLEVKCRSGACGAKRGVVVLHYFDLETREMVDTKVFNDPVVFFEDNASKKEA